MDPASQTLVGNMDKAAATNGATVAELTASGLAKGKGPARKRKREAFGDAQGPTDCLVWLCLACAH